MSSVTSGIKWGSQLSRLHALKLWESPVSLFFSFVILVCSSLWDTVCPCFISVAVGKCPDKSSLKEEKVSWAYSSMLQCPSLGNSRQETEAVHHIHSQEKGEMNHSCWLMFRPLSTLARDWCHPQWTGLLISIDQDNFPWTYPQVCPSVTLSKLF